MALNIRNPKADELAAEIARQTGETKTQAVVTALQGRLTQLRHQQDRGSGLAAELTAIANQCAALPVHDTSDADTILGYNAVGLPR